MSSKPLTGRKVFLMFAAFFGVIIGVNLVLAYQAVSTFPGLEVRNTYVASQVFDENKAAQLALGWTASAAVENDQLTLTIVGKDGAPAQVAQLSAILGRATQMRDDISPDFVNNGAAYVAPVELAPGNWLLRIKANAADGTLFDQRLSIFIGQP